MSAVASPATSQPNPDHVLRLAAELNIKVYQVAATAQLFAEGATVPFIARYRKEVTGELDEVQVLAIRDRLEQMKAIDERRAAILASLKERNLLTPALEKSINAADTLAVLEDIYLPFRPKKRTRATIAKEKGLEPLADLLWAQDPATDALAAAQTYVGKDYTAAQNHSHNGVDSALVAIGPNWLRNGSFEDNLTNWTSTAYTGGSIATTTSNETEGATGVSITSTVAANGGGNLLSDEYIPVIAGQTRQFMHTIKASGATVPIKSQVIWYDDAKAQISASDIINVTTSPTTDRLVVRRIAAPATAKFMRVKLELPTSAGGTGTIYFDGVIVGLPHRLGLQQVFTSGGTYSAVWGDVYVRVQGGGGGATAGNNGGGGGYAEGPVTTAGDVTVTVAAASASGGGGNTSSFGSHMSGTGGGVGGSGGTASGGSINIQGSHGTAGGASVLGLSANTGTTTNGQNYGAGATGVASSAAGAQGIVIVEA